MAKTVRDEDLRLNIIINGDNGRKEMGELQRKIHDTNAELELLKIKRKELEAQGKKDTRAYSTLQKQIDKYSGAIKENRERLAALQRQQSVNTMTLEELRKHINRVQMELNKTDPKSAQWARLNAELKLSKSRMVELVAQSKATNGVVCNLAERLNRYIGLITAGFATAGMFISGINRARNAFNEYDEAVTDASKTTNLTKGEVEQLSQSLKKLDTRTSQNQLLGLVEIAGKLGIQGRDNIEGFVRAADKINVSLSKDLGDNAEGALKEIGKLVDIFNLESEYGIETSMLKVGSAINSLGMSSTANEGYIVEFTKRLAGIAPNANISIQNVLGLAATLDSLGQMSETSTTALSQTIVKMFSDTSAFAKVAKMEVSEFKDLLAKDTNEALIRVLEGMSGSDMAEASAALESLNLRGTRAEQILGTLAKNTDKLREQQALSNKSFAEGNSVMEEFDRKNTSATAQMEKAKKAVTESAVELGGKLTPILTTSLSLSTRLIYIMLACIEVVTKWRLIIIALTAAYAANVAMNKAVVLWKQAAKFWSEENRKALIKETLAMESATAASYAWAAAKALLAGNIKLVAVALKGMFAAMGPIGWITLGITALGSAWAILETHWRNANKAQRELSSAMKTAATDAAVERTELDKLIGKLSACKEGTQEYADTQQEIIDKFGKYDSTLTKEGVSVDTLRDKYDELSAAIMQSAKNRQYKTFIENQQKSFDEQFGEISDKLWEHLSDKYYTEKASKYYNQIMDAFMRGSSLDPWLTSGHAKTQRLVKELEKLRTSQNKIQADARARFGIKAEPTPATPTKIASGVDENNNGDDPYKGSGSTDDKKWSLDKDEEYLQQRLALKNKYLNGEYASEQAYEDALLALEIKFLQERLAQNKEKGAERLALQEQLTEKQITQKEKQVKNEEEAEKQRVKNEEEVNKIIAELSTDRIEKENADYERRKSKLTGNTKALEALEKAHAARLAKIYLEDAEAQRETDEAKYKSRRRSIIERNRQETALFTGSQRERKEMTKRHYQELNALDKEYLEGMLNQLRELVKNHTITQEGIAIPIDISDKDLAELYRQIEELEQKLAELGVTSDATDATSTVRGRSFLGLGKSEWEDLFKGNIKSFEGWASTIGTLTENIGNEVMSVWGNIDKAMTASENRQLKLYQKNNEKKKKSFEDRLNAGLMTQAQYDAEMEAMQAAEEAYQEELALKQAKRQKAMNISQALINTAVAVTQTFAEFGWPFGIVPAGIMAALGAAEVATIAAQPIVGAEAGGPINVTRAQDGKPFKARLNPAKRGFISTPTVLVGENGTEYVIPNEALRNPTIYPFITAMEGARRNGTLRSINFDSIYSTPTVLGRGSGGYTETVTPISPIGTPSSSVAVEELLEMLSKLNVIFSKPIRANVVMLGKDGLVEQQKKYEELKKKGEV